MDFCLHRMCPIRQFTLPGELLRRFNQLQRKGRQVLQFINTSISVTEQRLYDSLKMRIKTIYHISTATIQKHHLLRVKCLPLHGMADQTKASIGNSLY